MIISFKMWKKIAQLAKRSLAITTKIFNENDKIIQLAKWSTLQALLMACVGCGSSITPFVPMDDPTEITAALIGGASSSGSLAQKQFNKSSFFSYAMKFLNPFLPASASGACPIFSAGACLGGSETLTYNACTSTGGNNASWSGSQILTFGSNAQCNAGVPVCGIGNNLTSRTFGANTLETPSSGNAISLDTASNSGYLTPQVNGGFSLTGTATGNNLAINGIHVTVIYNGSPSSDYTFTTNASLGGAPLTVAIPTCGSAARTITAGTVIIEYNPTKYFVTTTFNNVAWNGTSCFPQSGTISGIYSNGPHASLTFTGGGNATLIDAGGRSNNITLRHCF